MPTLGFFDVLGAPLVAVMLFSGILAYLGVHIVRRQVIFVDLALGQVAALGVLIGFLFGLEPSSVGAQLFAIGSTFFAAALFAVTRQQNERIPQEAIIGVVFAVANALTFIVVDRSPHGAEHITDILTGSLLWTTWSQVGQAAAVLALAAAALAAAHRHLVALSGAASGAASGGRRTFGFDFLFFACFGLVISATVRTAGVLPTFAMLVAPAIVAALAVDAFGPQLLVAWGVSLLVGVAALVSSYLGDLPAGPTLVCAHGVALLLGALGLHVARAPRRGRAAASVALGFAVAALLIAAIVAGGRWLAGSSWANPDLATGGSAAAAAADPQGERS